MFQQYSFKYISCLAIKTLDSCKQLISNPAKTKIEPVPHIQQLIRLRKTKCTIYSLVNYQETTDVLHRKKNIIFFMFSIDGFDRLWAIG